MTIIRPPPRLTNRSGILKFITVDLWSWMKELSVAFLKINFKDNFQSFTVNNLTIKAGKTNVAVANQFKTSYPGAIPTGRIIFRQQGNGVIVDGSVQWDQNFMYLSNPSANDITISVLFYL